MRCTGRFGLSMSMLTGSATVETSAGAITREERVGADETNGNWLKRRGGSVRMGCIHVFMNYSRLKKDTSTPLHLIGTTQEAEARAHLLLNLAHSLTGCSCLSRPLGICARRLV